MHYIFHHLTCSKFQPIHSKDETDAKNNAGVTKWHHKLGYGSATQPPNTCCFSTHGRIMRNNGLIASSYLCSIIYNVNVERRWLPNLLSEWVVDESHAHLICVIFEWVKFFLHWSQHFHPFLRWVERILFNYDKCIQLHHMFI